MAATYALDNHALPGEIVIRIENRPTHFAGSIHDAEIFARRATSDNPVICLPSETETARSERISRFVTAILQAFVTESMPGHD